MILENGDKIQEMHFSQEPHCKRKKVCRKMLPKKFVFVAKKKHIKFWSCVI